MWSRQTLAGNPNLARLGRTNRRRLLHPTRRPLHPHLRTWLTGALVGAGDRPHQQSAFCPGLEGEDLASAILGKLDTGALRHFLDTAWCANGEELAIHGTGGRVEYRYNRWLAVSSASGPFQGRVVNYTGGQVEAFGGPEGEEQVFEVRPPAFGDTSNPLNQHRLFLEAARDNKPAPVSIESGVHDMRVVMAVYESARTGRTVTL